MLPPLLLAAVVGASAPCPQQFVTQRVSLDMQGREGTGSSLNPALSADGRHVAFQSNSSFDALASGFTDIYVRDRLDGTTTLLSFGQGGMPANSLSTDAQLSDDGRFVVFTSAANNLVTGDTNGFDDVFLADRDPDLNGIFDEGNLLVSRISLGAGGVEANAPCTSPSISGDGEWISFTSLATNLVAGDANGASDVFVCERSSGTLRIVSRNSANGALNGASGPATLSSDGRFVAFESISTNAVAGDSNGARDIFLRDRDPDLNGVFDEATDLTVRVSVSTAGAEANADCFAVEISADGTQLVFHSAATTLVGLATHGNLQVFLHDSTTSVTSLISRSFSGNGGNGDSSFASLSADGRVIAFQSRANDLVLADTNGWDDVFRVDLPSGQLERASVSVPGQQATLFSQRPAVNADGTEVAFQSPAANLVALDTNGLLDVFVRTSGSWSPQLLLPPLQRGQGATVRATNCLPGEAVYFLYSFVGVGTGPCPPLLGGLCLDLLQPIVNLGAVAASSDGLAVYNATIPPATALVPVYGQVVVPRGPGGAFSVKSRVAIETVLP